MTGKYEDYLLSDDWVQFASDFKKRKGNKCELCGSDDTLHIHHLQYSLNLKNEDDLIVLCSSCHKCIHNCIERFKRQMLRSNLISYDVQRDIFKKSMKDIFQNSLYKAGSHSTVNGFEKSEFSRIRDVMRHQIEIKYPDIETESNGHIYAYLANVTLEYSGVLEWRNDEIANALNDGVPAYTIQKRFRISDGTFYKILNKLKSR